MRTRTVVGLVAIVLVMAMAPQAWAQVSGVIIGGDHGKIAAVEVDTGSGIVLRGGTVGRASADASQHEWDWTAGAAWRFSGDSPLSMDLGLDFEPMAPGVRVPGADVRARIGGAWAVTDRASFVVERSRSLRNGTNYGRLMLGGRVGF